MARKPARAALNDAVRAEMVRMKTERVTHVERVTNHRKGTTLHLGDGRKLAFGESAEVAADVRAAIVAAGSGE